MNGNMFDEVHQYVWNVYLPYYIISVCVILLSGIWFIRNLLLKDGVIYFRDVTLLFCGLVLGLIPLVNSAFAILVAWWYVGCPALIKCLSWLDSHEKDVVFRLKK